MTATVSSPASHLARELGSDQALSTRPIDRIKYAHDASHFLYTPDVVVQARSAREVAAAFRASASSGAPVVLRSGGTSLSGQAGGAGMLVDVRCSSPLRARSRSSRKRCCAWWRCRS